MHASLEGPEIYFTLFFLCVPQNKVKMAWRSGKKSAPTKHFESQSPSTAKAPRRVVAALLHQSIVDRWRTCWSRRCGFLSTSPTYSPRAALTPPRSASRFHRLRQNPTSPNNRARQCLRSVPIQDVLSLPEVELMAILDAGLPTARAAIAHVSEAACPPCQTVPLIPPYALLATRWSFWGLV